MDNQQIKSINDSNSLYLGLWTQYKVRLIKGAYDQLLCYPQMKEYVTNSSTLENGVRYSIPTNGVKFDQKVFSIECLLDTSGVEPNVGETKTACHLRYLEAFITKLSSSPFCLKIISLGKVFRLVYMGYQRNECLRDNITTFELKLVEPNPSERTE